MLSWIASHRAHATDRGGPRHYWSRSTRSGRAGPRSFRQVDGPWSEAVLRSLITLKALTHRETGGIVAARPPRCPSSSAGARNWDYRFCWLRDATLDALCADGIAGFSTRRRPGASGCCAPSRAPPRTCRSCTASAGERRLTEYELPWLPGYEGSAPVRIGNAGGRAASARCLWRGDRRPARGAAIGTGRQTSAAGPSRRRWSSIWRRSGSSRTTASGRCAAAASISRIRRSWPGWPSIAPCARSRSSGSRGRSSAGAACATRSTTTSASVVSIPLGTASCSTTAAGARCEPAADPAGRLPAAGRSARGGHGGGHRARAWCATVSCCATTPRREPTACRPARARSSRAASGSPTTTPCRADARRPRALRAAARSAQRCRAAGRGIRPAREPPARQFSPGVLASRAAQHRAQPHQRVWSRASACRRHRRCPLRQPDRRSTITLARRGREGVPRRAQALELGRRTAGARRRLLCARARRMAESVRPRQGEDGLDHGDSRAPDELCEQFHVGTGSGGEQGDDEQDTYHDRDPVALEPRKRR